MRDREMETAKRFGVFERIESLEKRLLDINHVVDVEFDLSGFYDDIRQVIIVPKYNISVSEPNYFDMRREMLKQILDVANTFGLKSSGDTIEDHGEHFYIVRACDDSWVLQQGVLYADPEVVAAINAVALEVVGTYDWTMPKYSIEEYVSYDEYESNCLDIGHEKRSEVCGAVIKRLVEDGKIAQGDESYYELIDEAVWEEITNCIHKNQDKEPVKKVFEVWKDTETGQTYKVKGGFATWVDAADWVNAHERTYPGWHLRIVETEEVKYVPKKYSDYFMMDSAGVDRMTINAAGRTPELAERFFYDKFGYMPDVVKTLDKAGGTVDVLKDVRDGIDKLIDSAKSRSNETIGTDAKTTDFVKE